MSFGQIAALMRRHLVAMMVIIVLTAGMAWNIKRTPPPYTESANVIFTPPSPNPYSSFSDFTSALLSTADIMSQTMLSTESQQKVLAAGGTADFSLGLVNFNNEQFPYYGDPYVTVSATAVDPATDHRTFTIAVKLFQQLVSERQAVAGTSPGSSISTNVVADTGPVAVTGSHKRVYAGLVMLAIVIAFLVVIFLDRHPIWPRIRRRLAGYSPSPVRFRSAMK